MLSALLTRYAVRVKTGSLLQVTTNYDGRFNFPYIHNLHMNVSLNFTDVLKITLTTANLQKRGLYCMYKVVQI